MMSCPSNASKASVTLLLGRLPVLPVRQPGFALRVVQFALRIAIFCASVVPALVSMMLMSSSQPLRVLEARTGVLLLVPVDGQSTEYQLPLWFPHAALG